MSIYTIGSTSRECCSSESVCPLGDDRNRFLAILVRLTDGLSALFPDHLHLDRLLDLLEIIAPRVFFVGLTHQTLATSRLVGMATLD